MVFALFAQVELRPLLMVQAALTVDKMRIFQMENVFVNQDMLLIQAEFALLATCLRTVSF